MGGRVFIGKVVSNRMQKTVVVAVHHAVWVPKYKVYQKRVSRHKVHDPEQTCIVGDIVRIHATRKLSKEKSYRLAHVIRRASVFRADEAATVASERVSRPAVNVVDAAQARVQEATQRLAKLREMYAKEMGEGASVSGLPPPAAASGTQAQ